MGALALAEYIQDQLLALHDTKVRAEEDRNPALYWTGKKADLIETVYALKTSKAVNKENVCVAELATAMAEVFGEELQDYYRTFVEIKNRKKNRAVFLDHCKEHLEAHMKGFEARG